MEPCSINPAEINEAAQVIADALVYISIIGALVGFFMAPTVIRGIYCTFYYFRHGDR